MPCQFLHKFQHITCCKINSPGIKHMWLMEMKFRACCKCREKDCNLYVSESTRPADSEAEFFLSTIDARPEDACLANVFLRGMITQHV